MTPALPPGLLLAYRRSCYRVGEAVVRVGRRSVVADALLTAHGARSAVLLTAWNPYSRRMPEGWNRRMQRSLAGALRQRVALEAEGSWHSWREAHLLVIGPVAPGTVVARRFRQRAVVVLRRGDRARLVML